MADSEDKRFAPTPSRRLKAREQGEIARSRELTATVSFLAATLALIAEGGLLGRSLTRAWMLCFDFAATPRSRLLAMLPLALAAGIVAAAAVAGALVAGAGQGMVF